MENNMEHGATICIYRSHHIGVYPPKIMGCVDHHIHIIHGTELIGVVQQPLYLSYDGGVLSQVGGKEK